MNETDQELAHTVVMSLMKSVVIIPTHGMSYPYQATIEIAKNSWPTEGHPYSVTCQGETPLHAARSMYIALRQWCYDPTSDIYCMCVLRAGPTPQIEPDLSNGAERERR